MNFAISVHFYRPVFHGLTQKSQPEWPPSPLRLVQALMAGYGTSGKDPAIRDSLEALVCLPPPVIQAPQAFEARLSDYYAPRTGIPPKIGSKLKQYLNAGTLGLAETHRVAKPQSRTYLSDGLIEYQLTDPDNTVDLEALRLAAHAVGYFGRSQDLCDIFVEPTLTVNGPITWVPRATPDGNTRGWSVRSCTWMDINHRMMTDGSDRPRLTSTHYETRLQYHQAHKMASEHGDTEMLILAVDKPLPGHRVPAFLAPLEDAPVQYFPVVSAGHPRANGTFYGVGLLLDDTTVIDEALGEVVSRQPLLGLEMAEHSAAWTMNPAQWTKTGSRWLSATPLRAFPDERVVRYQLEQQVKQFWDLEPTAIHLEKQPAHAWQQRWVQLQDGIDQWWVTIELPEPVAGPVRLGTAWSYGYGLMIPEATS